MQKVLEMTALQPNNYDGEDRLTRWARQALMLPKLKQHTLWKEGSPRPILFEISKCYIFFIINILMKHFFHVGSDLTKLTNAWYTCFFINSLFI